MCIVGLIKHFKKDQGFTMLTVLSMTIAMSTSVFLFLILEKGISQFIHKTKISRTKNTLYSIAVQVYVSMKDVDFDFYPEPIKERSGSKVPLNIPASQTDSWGTELRYCTWDLGIKNNINTTFSQNNVTPPKPNLVFRIISAGPDRVFQTNCSDVTLSGDDLWYEWYTSRGLKKEEI